MQEDKKRHMTTKEHVIRLVEAIENENDMAMVKRLVEAYAARSLNKRYKEEANHEEAAD